MKRISFLLVLLCALFWGAPAYGQNYEQMRKEILQEQKQTRAEIEQLNSLINTYQKRLSKNQQEYDALFEQYEDLESLIALQQQKIESLQEEQDQIQDEITVTHQKMEQQQQRLEELIESYKETMRYVYIHGKTSRLALILAADSFNQMMVRNYYLKKFETYREKQVAGIKETQKELKQSEEQLARAAEKNEGVLANIQEEKESLQEKKVQQESNIALLRRDREQLQEKLNQVEQQKSDLNSTLNQLIARAEEVRKAQQERLRRQEAERKKKLAEAKNIENEAERKRAVEKYDTPVVPVGFLSDERMAEIENSFASQKGELPWPVESSTISVHFGLRRHPVYGTVTRNLGVEILSEAGAPVRVVHDGYVFAVQPITGYGNVVFVSHGKYKTAYGNLSRVLVRKNSILEKGDIIGYSGHAKSERGESVFFMLRMGSENIDPEDWLINK